MTTRIDGRYTYRTVRVWAYLPVRLRLCYVRTVSVHVKCQDTRTMVVTVEGYSFTTGTTTINGAKLDSCAAEWRMECGAYYS